MPKLGALSTLLVFAVAMSNVAFGEKIYSEHSVKKDCPYDVMSMFDLPEEQGVSMKDGREIIEQYSPLSRSTINSIPREKPPFAAASRDTWK